MKDYTQYTSMDEDEIIAGLVKAGVPIDDILNRALEKAQEESYDEGYEVGKEDGFTAGYEARAAE